ncbi:MAG: SGNH/GDSL hydrolase family protein [Alphaproteobacteria bacterium]
MKTLLCFGDSNTHGTVPMAKLSDRQRYDHATRWPGLVARSLGAAWHVVEEGHPGRTTVFPDPIEGNNKSGLASLTVALESHRPIELVLIMLGTNDLKTRFSNTLVAPPPILEVGCIAELFEGGAAKSSNLAALYRDVAERQNCAFVDAGSVIESSGIDGIHLAPEAHQRLGETIADAIQERWGA